MTNSIRLRVFLAANQRLRFFVADGKKLQASIREKKAGGKSIGV